MTFDTPLTIMGPVRAPKQMLAEQTYDGHVSVHDEATADSLGLRGAPIEGPTHFSLFDPLAHAVWGDAWFERGCISAHFQNMVIEGEETMGSLAKVHATSARIDATKSDGTPVLTGTASIGDAERTELDTRLAKAGDPGDLFIVDQLTVGDTSGPVSTLVDLESSNGELYPFSLRQKLDAITERSRYYDTAENPWRRPIIPMEMLSVLSEKAGAHFPVRGPAVGLFLDLEVRLVNGPVFVGQEYSLTREVVGLGQSRRTESNWVRSTISDPATGDVVATVLLHSGVFKDSYAGYPSGD